MERGTDSSTAATTAHSARTRPDAAAEIFLELRNLSKRYGPIVALRELSFSVEEGQVFGFVGSNGAGKTTAMRIVLGLLEPDGGETLWRGEPMDAAVRRRVGYMPEERGLYPKMRAGEQISYFARLHGFPKGEAETAARKWLERLGVAERAGDKVETLSLGNQQRVQLAAALVHEPELLVLDEPFSGLDPVAVDAMSEVLLERAEAGVPVLFSSHQLELVERLCDSVAIVKDGALVASGTVGELRSSDRRLLRVRVEGRGGRALTNTWFEGLDGVRSADGPARAAGADGNLLALEAGVDEQLVLDAARAAGKVTHFAFEQRSLADIFRKVMEA